MVSFGGGLAMGIAIGMGSGLAVGTSSGVASARKQLKKQLSSLLRTGEAHITDKDQSPIDAEAFVEMIFSKKGKR